MSYTFLKFPGFLDKALTLSYDDGVIYDKQLIKIMSEYGLKGTFNLNSKLFAEEPNQARLTVEDAIRLYTESGNEIALHGAEHLSLTDVSSAIATADVVQDREFFERILKKPVCGMAYANGKYNDQVVEILKMCGVRYARTVTETMDFQIPADWLRWDATCHHANPKLMELAHRFIETPPSWYFWANQPKLFYLWGHSYEFNDQNNWEIFEEFAAYVGKREDVWYATNIEIYDYVKAYNELQWGINNDFVYNPSVIDVYLNYYGKHVLAKAGEVTLFEDKK